MHGNVLTYLIERVAGQPQQQQQGSVCPSVARYMPVCAPAYFNDERDEVLKKWNQLQAVWGTGKGMRLPAAGGVWDRQRYALASCRRCGGQAQLFLPIRDDYCSSQLLINRRSRRLLRIMEIHLNFPKSHFIQCYYLF